MYTLVSAAGIKYPVSSYVENSFEQEVLSQSQ